MLFDCVIVRSQRLPFSTSKITLVDISTGIFIKSKQ